MIPCAGGRERLSFPVNWQASGGNTVEKNGGVQEMDVSEKRIRINSGHSRLASPFSANCCDGPVPGITGEATFLLARARRT